MLGLLGKKVVYASYAQAAEMLVETLNGRPPTNKIIDMGYDIKKRLSTSR